MAKTDGLDAHILALFAERVQLDQRTLPDAEAQALGALLARRRQLVEMRTAEKNRLGSALPRVKPGIQAHINWLEQELTKLGDELGRSLRESPVWREKLDNFTRASSLGISPYRRRVGSPALSRTTLEALDEQPFGRNTQAI